MSEEPKYSFLAESSATPKRIFRIWSEPYSENGVPMNSLSWCFYVGEIEESGEEEPVYDGWDPSFDIIIQYPPMYSSEELQWFDELGNKVDLAALSMKF